MPHGARQWQRLKSGGAWHFAPAALVVHELAVLPLRCGFSGRDSGGDFGSQHIQPVLALQRLWTVSGKRQRKIRQGPAVAGPAVLSQSTAGLSFTGSGSAITTHIPTVASRGPSLSRRPLKPDVGFR